MARVGKFKIGTTMIEQYPDDVRAVMATCIIVRAEYHYIDGAIEYEAISPLFSEVKLGEVVPSYQCVITRTPPLNQIEVAFR